MSHFYGLLRGVGGIRPFVAKIAGDWRSFRKNGGRAAGLSGYEGAKMLELGRSPCNERLLVQTHIAIAEPLQGWTFVLLRNEFSLPSI
jgi:hypothetical protein